MVIGFICVALAASCLGIMPSFQKELLVGGLPMDSLMFFTNWVITLFSLGAAIVKKQSLKAKPVQWMQACCMGVVGLLITAVLLNTSYHYLPVGTSIMLNFLYPSIHEQRPYGRNPQSPQRNEHRLDLRHRMRHACHGLHFCRRIIKRRPAKRQRSKPHYPNR